MTQQPKKQRYQPRSRRLTRENGLPYLSAQLPPDFRCPSHVNAFIYSLTTEVTAGRVEARTAAVLGYLSQLAIQTLPLLRIEAGLTNASRAPFDFITHIPRPRYPGTVDSDPQPESQEANRS